MSIIQDPQGKGRPVYAETYNGANLYLPSKDGSYEFDRSYISLESLKAEYPNAVRHVNRRSSPLKKRHPDIHYEPARHGAYCRTYLPEQSTVTDDQTLNLKRTTNLARVTCPVCLLAVQRIVAAKLAKSP